MGYWQRHPRKELEAVLVAFDAAGWRITKGRSYYKTWCPCGQHRHTVHLTPSNPNYARDVLQWLGRQPCNRRES